MTKNSSVFASGLQVLRVLPGGLEVVGLYVVTPSESLKGFYPRLKQLLDGQQVMSQSFTFSKDRSLEVLSAPHNSRFLLHCCSKTKKYLCTRSFYLVFVFTFVLVCKCLEWDTFISCSAHYTIVVLGSHFCVWYGKTKDIPVIVCDVVHVC